MKMSPKRKEYFACAGQILDMLDVPKKQIKLTLDGIMKNEAESVSFNEESLTVQDEPSRVPAPMFHEQVDRKNPEQLVSADDQAQTQEAQTLETAVIQEQIPEVAPLARRQIQQDAPVIPPEAPPQKRKLDEEEEVPRKKAKVDPEQKFRQLKANMEELDRETECGLCLDNMAYPATLPCGHSYCLKCIGARDTSGVQQIKTCPECRKEFDAKLLNRNVILEKCIKIVVRSIGPEKVEKYNERL